MYTLVSRTFNSFFCRTFFIVISLLSTVVDYIFFEKLTSFCCEKDGEFFFMQAIGSTLQTIHYY